MEGEGESEGWGGLQRSGFRLVRRTGLNPCMHMGAPARWVHVRRLHHCMSGTCIGASSSSFSDHLAISERALHPWRNTLRVRVRVRG